MFFFEWYFCGVTADKEQTLPRIPAWESAICKRLSQARKLLGLSQNAFASKIGIPRDRLASYEYGRAPLPADVAVAACLNFNISECWLCNGKAYYFQPSLFPDIDQFLRQMKPGMLFSQFYESVLQETVACRMASALAKEGHRLDRNRMQIDSAEEAKLKLRFLCEHWLESTPKDKLPVLVKRLLEVQQDFMEDNELIETRPLGTNTIIRKCKTGRR